MESVWNSEVNFRKREALNKNIECDIVIIGAGMAGLLTAYILNKSRREVVVIDGKSIAGGVTKNTTAKITCQHDLIYDNLIKEFGKDGARQYAKANQLAIQKYKEIIDEENIQKGHGGVVEYKDQKIGVYKDNDGNVFKVSTKCAHLGCELHWNADELTWDCPCHGSRYDYKGNWIQSPTNKSLPTI